MASTVTFNSDGVTVDGYTLTYSTIAEDVIAGAINKVPVVGSICSNLVKSLWPGADNSTWNAVQSQVSALIEEDLDTLESDTVNEDLNGLYAVMTDYNTALADNDVTTSDGKDIIRNQWNDTVTTFDDQLPHFQASGYEILLLPLWSQAVNLYMALLRDGLLFGVSEWGWTSDYQQAISSKMTSAIEAQVAYGKQWFQQAVKNVKAKTGSNNHDCQPFRTVNALVRQLTLSVSDYGELWMYMHPLLFPGQPAVHLAREIYSDPVGTCDDSGNIVLPTAPAKPPNSITVWAYDRIDAVQLTYPSGQGPGAVTTTARMGDKNGGSNQPPHGGVFNVQGNPVVVANGSAGDILNAFNFTFQNGSTTGKLGGSASTGGTGTGFSFSFAGHILSTIHINGISNYYQSADCAVFGFEYPEPDTTAEIYETNPLGWMPAS